MTADSSMSDENVIGQGRNELIAAGGEFGGNAASRRGERGQNEQATGSQGLFPVGQHALGQGTGRANDYWLGAAQKNA